MNRLSCAVAILAAVLLSGCLGGGADPGGVDDGKLILVTGATGRQGGAVARELLRRGYRVRGLTRNPDSERALLLAEIGVEMVQGDFDDPSSLRRALESCYGAFAMQDFWEHGYEGEVRQGKSFADAALAAGVQHLVYSSVASADEKTGIPHFESKFEIEEHIRAIRIPYTILRPVSFMENWEWSREEIRSGKLSGPLPADRKQQFIAVRDIGWFAAQAFDNPDRWLGQEIALAGDEMTMTEVAETFGRVTGQPVEYSVTPWDTFEAQVGEEITVMARWFDDVGYSVDIDELRAIHPGLMTVEQYLRDAGWARSTR